LEIEKLRIKRCEKCGLILHKNSKGCSLKCENNKIRGIKMTKKKKEIIDGNDLEVMTPEVAMREFKKAGEKDEKKQAEFYYESLIIPANLLRAPLEDASIFFNILIEVLDPDYHYDNKFESFREEELYHGGMICRAFKNIKVEHTGDARNKDLLLEILSDLITHLDYARIKLFITDEQAERKAGDVVDKRWREYQEKKQQKERKNNISKI